MFFQKRNSKNIVWHNQCLKMRNYKKIQFVSNMINTEKPVTFNFVYLVSPQPCNVRISFYIKTLKTTFTSLNAIETIKRCICVQTPCNRLLCIVMKLHKFRFLPYIYILTRKYIDDIDETSKYILCIYKFEYKKAHL